MKLFKIAFLKITLALLIFSSCTNNNEPIFQEDLAQIEDSTSITETIELLRTYVNNDGSINMDENPNGNIIFDFCFDFVYPLTLSFNNDTLVTVNSFEDLIDIIVNSSDNLFIDGIEFPFQVETFNDDSDAVEILTINNEEEFMDLLEDCDFDAPDCNCTEEYDPVCVEIVSASGEMFIITFPNECYAECEGFTDNDFIDDCDDDNYNGGSDDDCFTFNFPITIIVDQNETITINSEDELDVAIYTANWFDFVYPISVTLEDGTVVTVENEAGLADIFDDCYDYEDDCDCDDVYDPVCVEVQLPVGGTEIFTFINACEAECEGFTPNDFIDCENNGGGDCDCPDDYDPVCVQMQSGTGDLITITFPNACFAECEGYTNADFIDCDEEDECTEEDYISNLLACPWEVDNASGNYTYTFNQDGTLTITGNNNNDATTGTWSFNLNQPNVDASVTIDALVNDFDDTWFFIDCDPSYEVYTNNNTLIERACD